MIGYTPFLGQVRLGQAVQDTTIVIPERISRLRRKIETADVRPGVRQALVDKINTCERMLPNGRDYTDFQAVIRCLDELDEVLASPLLPMMVTREETEKQVAAAQKPAIPTLAYVLGGVALLGGGLWLAGVFSKK